MPIVKHAIYSGIGDDIHFFIDGYANTGFSRSPMVFKPSNTNTNDFRIAGLVVNYKPEIIRVYETELEAKNNGTGKQPIGYMRANSGTITASWIMPAVDIINNRD